MDKIRPSKIRATSPGGDNLHGHHIVMKGDGFPENAQARNILCKHGINPFTDCANLVIAKNHCHSAAYAKEVLRRLKAADTPGANAEEIKEVLQGLAEWHRRCGTGETANDDDE